MRGCVPASCLCGSWLAQQRVAAGRAALKGEWGTMSVVKRAELLHAVADEINRRFDDFLALRRELDPRGRLLNDHLRHLFGIDDKGQPA